MKHIIRIIFIVLLLSGCSQTDDERRLVPITISGLDTVTHFIGETLPDLLEDITLDHNFYTMDITNLEIQLGDLNWNEEGVYIIFYRIESPSGVVTRNSRIVTVLNKGEQEVTAYPVILNTKDINYFIGDPTPDYLENVQAFDFNDGFIQIILVDDSEVDYAVEGVYPVTLSATNRKGLETIVTIQVTVTTKEEPLNIIYFNDFHGAILPTDTQMGLSSIGAYIESLNPLNTLFISGGDLLQGSVLSNYYYGMPIIEALNALGHEAFTIGNHEFDWGIEQVLNYKDSEFDVVANFNFLGTNIVNKDTDTRLENVLPYEIFERNGMKIGVIGAMGYGLESSIATSKIRDYQFNDPVTHIASDAHILRTQYNVDIVLAVVHSGDNQTNQRLANLTGTSKVDMIFNGHTHQTYIQSITHVDNHVIPVIQTGAYGQNIAHITVDLTEEGIELDAKMLNRNNTPSLYETSEMIDAIIEPYYLTIQSLIETELMKSGQYYSRGDLTTFVARLMADEVGADIGIHNYGGTRVAINYLESITVGKAYEILPFDNIIKTVMLKGSDINQLLSRFTPNELYIKPNTVFLEDTYYKVATNDYIFDKEDYPFITGEDIVNTGILIRDLFIDAVTAQQAFDYFYISQYVLPLGLMDDAWIERMSYGTFI